uniref:Ribulose bisphosphate carboxylase small subunit, chloroplastic n=1 Tax=Kalanchoe fedtschenkoi TaxID=63787 RepID=A0A7N0VCE0_KALFE
MASMMSSAAVAASVSRSPAQAIAPFTGLKAGAALPSTCKPTQDITSIANNGGRVRCMQVWPPVGKKKYETLSYLPPLSDIELAKEVDYLLRKGWIPCLEFELEQPFIHRANNRSPGYYDGRYWVMWKLPMYGCTDSSQVLKEVEEAKKEYPTSHVRIIGFDNRRQVQCISFIAYKPPGY